MFLFITNNYPNNYPAKMCVLAVASAKRLNKVGSCSKEMNIQVHNSMFSLRRLLELYCRVGSCGKENNIEGHPLQGLSQGLLWSYYEALGAPPRAGLVPREPEAQLPLGTGGLAHRACLHLHAAASHLNPGQPLRARLPLAQPCRLPNSYHKIRANVIQIRRS